MAPSSCRTARRNPRRRDRELRRGTGRGRAARGSRGGGDQGRGAVGGDLPPFAAEARGLRERFPGRPALPDGQPREALARDRPRPAAGARGALEGHRAGRHRDHQRPARAPREIPARPRAPARRAPRADRRPRQRLRRRRPARRRPRLRLHGLLGALGPDGQHARSRGTARLDASRRRRPLRVARPRRRPARRASHPRCGRRRSGRRRHAPADRLLHQRQRHGLRARDRRAAPAPRSQGAAQSALEPLSMWRGAMGGAREASAGSFS